MPMPPVQAGIVLSVSGIGKKEKNEKADRAEKGTGGVLRGILRAPIVTGTVGGVTTLHPTAKLCLRMLGVRSASELFPSGSRCGAGNKIWGLLRALCTVGILKGHMRLHMDNMALSVGAKNAELPLLREKLTETAPHYLSHRRVREALEETTSTVVE